MRWYFHAGICFIVPFFSWCFVIRMPFLALCFFMNSFRGFRSWFVMVSWYFISMGSLLCIMSISLVFFQKVVAFSLFTMVVSTIFPSVVSFIVGTNNFVNELSVGYALFIFRSVVMLPFL